MVTKRNTVPKNIKPILINVGYACIVLTVLVVDATTDTQVLALFKNS